MGVVLMLAGALVKLWSNPLRALVRQRRAWGRNHYDLDLDDAALPHQQAGTPGRLRPNLIRELTAGEDALNGFLYSQSRSRPAQLRQLARRLFVKLYLLVVRQTRASLALPLKGCMHRKLSTAEPRYERIGCPGCYAAA